MLVAKANEYGYGDNLSEYIRGASLNESFIIEDVIGKELIFNIVSEQLSVDREKLKEIRAVCKKIILSKEDIDYLKKQQDNIFNNITTLIKTVAKILSLKYVRKSRKKKVQEDLITEE